MNVMLVDDEALARLRLRTLIDALPGRPATVVGEAADAEEALAMLQSPDASSIDAVLLDIRMPGVDPGRAGLRLAAAMQSLPQPPAVIFVSAHGEHALKAFELQAVDYLTKPVRSERLAAALQRVRPRNVAAPAAAAPAGPALVVTDRGRLLRLPLAEVLVMKAELKYVTLRTARGAHVLDESLSELEQRLAALGGAYIRIHRNALVARHAIRALELRPMADADDGAADGWAVRVAPLDEWLSVSRRQVAAVRAALAEGTA
jgi:two-component system response regulator AlgR